MHYCPECKSEFEDYVKLCPECEVGLVETLPQEDSEKFKDLEYKEIYVAFDELEYKNIIHLLRQNDINFLKRKMVSTAFPISIGENTGFRIAVADNDVHKALELIEEAIKDEYISDQGEFIE